MHARIITRAQHDLADLPSSSFFFDVNAEAQRSQRRSHAEQERTAPMQCRRRRIASPPKPPTWSFPARQRRGDSGWRRALQHPVTPTSSKVLPRWPTYAQHLSRLAPYTRSTPDRTICVPHTSSAIAASRFNNVCIDSYQGREYVLVLVKLFIASRTPSLYPKPESLIPPKGVSSSRYPGTSRTFTVPTCSSETKRVM